MDVPCPKCKEKLPVPGKLMSRGVARVVCDKCSFSFIVRLGDPGRAEKQEEPSKSAQPIEGLKSSDAGSSASGEIGGGQARFVAAETQTTIRVDPEFQQEISATEQALKTEPTVIDIPLPEGLQHAVTQPDLLSQQPQSAAVNQDKDAAGAETSTAKELAAKGDRFEAFKSVNSLAVPPPGAEVSPPPAPSPPPQPAPSHNPPTDQEISRVPVQQVTLPNLPSPTNPQQVTFGGEVESTPPPQSPTPVLSSSEVPLPTQSLTPLQSPFPGSSYPLIITPDPHAQGEMLETTAEMDLDVYTISGSSSGTGMKWLGLLVTLIVLGAAIFFFYVLAKNDWSLDLARFGEMMDRAFGGEDQRRRLQDARWGLEVSPPIVEQARLAGGVLVLTVQGVVKNNDVRTRRFIYVRALLKDNHGRTVTSAEAPAGNVFNTEQLNELTPSRLLSQFNPAGRDGRNARLLSGETVAYMVVITRVPHDYTPSKHQVTAEVSQAEFYDEP